MNMAEAGKLGAIASLETRNKNKELRVEKYNKSPTRCKTCDCALPYKSRKNIFCNRSCKAKTTNTLRQAKIRVQCLNCNQSVNRNASKYCSMACQHEYHWRVKREKILLTGEVNGINQAKKYLKEVRGNSCEMCGIDSWAGKPILLLCDHINGNPVDYNLENLRLICSNCDATTPFYKGKNKGNGRAYRRQRYREGKSF